MGKPRTPKGRALETAARLAPEYPGTAKELCALVHDNPFQLLVATILSAQSTDATVNRLTPKLFSRFPTAADLAEANPDEVEELIKPSGFFRAKTQSLIGMAKGLVERYEGEVPPRMDDLVTLPGVGRKTANVVLSVDFDIPGLAVDTHVTRLSERIGLTTRTDPEKIEADLNKLLPKSEWGKFSLRLILHGRRVCPSRNRHCDRCVLNDFCPSSLIPTRRGRNVVDLAAKAVNQAGTAGDHAGR